MKYLALMLFLSGESERIGENLTADTCELVTSIAVETLPDDAIVVCIPEIEV